MSAYRRQDYCSCTRGLCVTPTVTPERKLDVATAPVVPLRSVQIKRLSATHRKGTVRLAVSGHHNFTIKQTL